MCNILHVSYYCRIFASENKNKQQKQNLKPAATDKRHKIMTKQVLESTLTKVAGVAIEITFARTNLVTLFWEGKDESAFEKLQKYFKGILFDYEYDEECDASVCCLSL